ncbi:hypothetical protein HU200_018513 [Digitaria exilis]|uniref:Uncharacterized protein n=1 Tax=Digitaria exilis TaxID=1010633 RepID=A0A835F404_9POAL|nr:hypothetical protein HU200_018513 [Digitaria exilis]
MAISKHRSIGSGFQKKRGVVAATGALGKGTVPPAKPTLSAMGYVLLVVTPRGLSRPRHVAGSEHGAPAAARLIGSGLSRRVPHGRRVSLAVVSDRHESTIHVTPTGTGIGNLFRLPRHSIVIVRVSTGFSPPFGAHVARPAKIAKQLLQPEAARARDGQVKPNQTRDANAPARTTTHATSPSTVRPSTPTPNPSCLIIPALAKQAPSSRSNHHQRWPAPAAAMEKKLLLLPMTVAHKHGVVGERMWARPWRWAKTAFFLAAMLASLLLVCAPPLLVVLLDLALPPALLSASLRSGAADASSFASAALAQARAFDFRSSLVDLPAVSAARALLILCEFPDHSLFDLILIDPLCSTLCSCVMAGAYVVCGGGGAYLWVVVACAAGSVSYVLAKAAAVLPRRAAMQVAGEARAVAAAGPEAMMLLSLALAAAHLAAAYRTSCRERRRMLVYRIDVEGAYPRPPAMQMQDELCSTPKFSVLTGQWRSAAFS